MNINFLSDEYNKKYGSDRPLTLRALDEEAFNSIFSRFEDFIDNNPVSIDSDANNLHDLAFFEEPMSLTELLQDLDNSIRDAIEAAFFRQLTRANALVVLNTLSLGCALATFSIVNGMEYSWLTFMEGWNNQHQGEEISINGSYLP